MFHTLEIGHAHNSERCDEKIITSPPLSLDTHLICLSLMLGFLTDGSVKLQNVQLHIQKGTVSIPSLGEYFYFKTVSIKTEKILKLPLVAQ